MMLKQATEDLDNGDGVYVRYRTDGSLFNLRRLQTYSKALEQLIRDLFAEDDAHTERALRCITSYFAEAAQGSSSD